MFFICSKKPSSKVANGFPRERQELEKHVAVQQKGIKNSTNLKNVLVQRTLADIPLVKCKASNLQRIAAAMSGPLSR